MHKYKIYISDQPESALLSKEIVSESRINKFHRDLSMLVNKKHADYHGRAWNKNTGNAYQIFTLEGKRICLEDPDATQVLKSLFDTDGQLREVDIK